MQKLSPEMKEQRRIEKIKINRDAYHLAKQEKQIALQGFEQDEHGERYKSEVSSYGALYKIYTGENRDRIGLGLRVVRPISTPILGRVREFKEWLELRDRARKDLFWLAVDVLHKDFNEATHRVVCDLFIKKNFDGVYREGYTIGDVHKAIDRQERFDKKGRPTKEMMLLDPRGFLKSTLDGIDCVQWLLNVPDIRILILTGEYKLAVAFMREIKRYFYYAVGAEPSEFQLLFPEYILTGVNGVSKEPLECPVRKHNQVAASVWVNSIIANLSGWHCDIRKADDVVTDENCNTEDTRESLKDKFDGTENLLDEWGFTDYIGTRYYTDDLYAKRIEIMEELPLLYHSRACWTVKPEYRHLPLASLMKDMVILTFPEKATYKSLRKKLLMNERSFRNQQLNEPSETNEDTGFKLAFDEDLLRAHMYQGSAAPQNGDLYITWDWAPSSSKGSDMSVGVAARVTKTDKMMSTGIESVYGLSVLEIIYDRWKPSELAYQIVAFNKKWNPKQTLIEKSLGAELLQLEIQRQAMRYATPMVVYWQPPLIQADAKRNRIKGLETLLVTDRLWFVNGPWMDQTIYQFVRYTGERKNKGRKDDILDALSFMTFFLPSTELNEDLKKIQDAQAAIVSHRAQYDRIFGGPASVLTPDPEPAPSTDPRAKFGIPGLRF